MDINVVHGYKNLCKHKPWLWESLQAHIDQADQKLSAACPLSSLHLEMPPLQSVSAWASILGTDRLKILGIHNYIHKSDKCWYQNRDNLIPFWKSHTCPTTKCLQSMVHVHKPDRVCTPLASVWFFDLFVENYFHEHTQVLIQENQGWISLWSCLLY